MRLPWLQVDKKGIASCQRVARRLGIPESQGVGIGIMLWEYALEISADGDFTGIIPDGESLAIAVQWPVNDADRLLKALQCESLVATTPSLRCCGLDRYKSAWEKNQRRNGKPTDSRESIPATGRNRPVPPGNRDKPRGTGEKTETETEKKASAPAKPTQARDSDRLCADFLEVVGPAYAWQGAKDGTALAHLLTLTTIDEVSRRWRLGLKAPAADWASCRTVAQLRSKWNDLATVKAAFVSIEHQPSRIY